MGIVEIPLTQGQVAIVDEDDFPSIKSMKWCAYQPKGSNTFYAVTGYRAGPNKWRIKYMHRVLTACPTGLVVDHKDGNGLNNRRSNLVVCTKKQNNARGSKHIRGRSKFRGVCWHGQAKKWLAQLGVRGEGAKKYLGLFSSEEDAARAYDAAARAAFGEFAYQNFPAESV